MDASQEYRQLWGEMLEIIRDDAPLDDAQFDALALRIFRVQYALNTVYRAYCDARANARPSSWLEIPALPAAAFKRTKITSFPQERAATYFQTSGTTEAESGRHWFESTELYKAAVVPTFRNYVMGDVQRLPMHMIIPPPQEAPHSSLVHMMQTVSAAMATPCAAGAPGSARDAHYYIRANVLDFTRLFQHLEEASSSSTPVLLMGTAFGLLNVLDEMNASGRSFKLADGTRIMETGGFKGRSRELRRQEFYAELESHFGVPQSNIINEYGMTELSSQFYDASLVEGAATARKQGSSRARVQVVDPLAGTPLPCGEQGLIKVWDLANLGSVAFLQTEDVGIMHPNGDFELLGRVAQAQPRGCSLDAETSRTQVV